MRTASFSDRLHNDNEPHAESKRGDAMRTLGFCRRMLRAGALGLALIFPMHSGAAVIDIPGLVVFGAPAFSLGAENSVDVPLILTQQIAALSGFIVLTSTPHPESVLISEDYKDMISIAMAGRPDLLQIEILDPSKVLLPGQLLTWHFLPIPVGAQLTIDPAFSYVDLFDLVNTDSFAATTTIPPIPVPEPESMLLMLAGLSVLSVMGVRRRAAQR